MAKPTTARAGKFIVALGDGADPEVFTAPCGFTSRSLTLNKNLVEANIPDCDDPDAPDWVARDVQSLSASVNGDGLLAAESVEVWLDAYNTNDPVNVRITIDFGVGGMATFLGAMHIESFQTGAENGARVTAAITMQSDGEMTRTFV
jgi:hypothetical protein